MDLNESMLINSSDASQSETAEFTRLRKAVSANKAAEPPGGLICRVALAIISRLRASLVRDSKIDSASGGRDPDTALQINVKLVFQWYRM